MTAFTTSGPVVARLRFHGGVVQVEAAAADQAVATVEPLDAADERSAHAARAARIDCVGSRLTVDVPGKGRWGGGGIKVRIQLALPPGSTVMSDSGDVQLHADGALDGVRIRTGSGDVEVGEVRKVDVKAGDARVVITGSPDDVQLVTGNGSLTAEAVRDLVFKAGHGTATVGRSTGSIWVKGGKVGLDLGAAQRGEVLFQTGAGSARVGVADGTSVQLDLQSGLGDVRCDLAMEDAAPAGGSDLKVRLVTGLGDLVVARAS